MVVDFFQLWEEGHGNDYDINASKFDADKSFSLLRTGQLNGNFLFEDN